MVMYTSHCALYFLAFHLSLCPSVQHGFFFTSSEEKNPFSPHWRLAHFKLHFFSLNTIFRFWRTSSTKQHSADGMRGWPLMIWGGARGNQEKKISKALFQVYIVAAHHMYCLRLKALLILRHSFRGGQNLSAKFKCPGGKNFSMHDFF